METHPTALENLATRLEQLERGCRWRKHTGVAILICAIAVPLISAQGRPG